MRDKRDCMRLGTGLCPESEVWQDSAEQCDDCPHYIDRDGHIAISKERGA